MRLRFTIRDLLWLTALMALAVAWYLGFRAIELRHNEDLMNAAHKNADLDSQLKQAVADKAWAMRMYWAAAKSREG